MTLLAPPAGPPAVSSEPPRVRTIWWLHGLVAAVVWTVWAVAGGAAAFEAVRRDWPVTLTMVAGSLVGGGTSEGGGAVAFPVFTKVLLIPPPDARIFTYLIQSVGMGAATIVILAMRVPIERRVVLLGAPAGMVGVVLGVTLLGPALPAAAIRIGFTMLLTGLGIALVVRSVRRVEGGHDRIPVFGRREAAVVVAAGFAGGVVSGLVGVGENTVMFIVLVLLFRVSEKVGTPTTVVMMTLVSITAALTHLLVLRDVSAAVAGYWLAAAPVVVVFAPLGAVVCARMSRHAIRRTLLVLIAAEFLSTVLLVPMPAATATMAAALLLVLTAGCVALTRVRRYRAAPASAT